jgi:hypothetical protein
VPAVTVWENVVAFGASVATRVQVVPVFFADTPRST